MNTRTTREQRIRDLQRLHILGMIRQLTSKEKESFFENVIMLRSTGANMLHIETPEKYNVGDSQWENF